MYGISEVIGVLGDHRGVADVTLLESERSQVGEETWNMLEACILYPRWGLHNANTREI